MSRLLTLLLVFAFLWIFLLRPWLTILGLRRSRSRPAARVPPRGSRSRERLVPCARCGVYVVASRALPGGRGESAFYCSEACRRGETAPDPA